MITTLKVQGLRNLAEQTILIDSDLVIVTGANAQGKSSLLEAAYLLATTRSFRTRDPREAISHPESSFRVAGEITVPGQTPLDLVITRSRGRGERTLCVGQYIVKLAEYLGHLPALVMTGESTRSIAGSPSERRRYMDRATATAVPDHLPDLAEYKKALAQRNHLLRQETPDEQIEPWEEVLASSGERITRRRCDQLEAWQQMLGHWPDLFPEGKNSRLVYHRAGFGNQSREDEPSLAGKLREARSSDRRNRVTSVGPHRDDLAVEVDGRDLWRFGSAGQLRSALAATTLAQARQVRELRAPLDLLLILDDVDSDLDKTRYRALLSAARAEGQTFAATSKPAMAADLSAQQLRVEAGHFTPRATGQQ